MGRIPDPPPPNMTAEEKAEYRQYLVNNCSPINPVIYLLIPVGIILFAELLIYIF